MALAGRTAAVVLGTLIILASGCRDRYSQATPDDVLESARKMVENGDARRLHELIYAESPEWRALLREAGKVMGSLAALGEAVSTRFPDEVAKLRAQAEEAARSGQATGLLSRVAGATGGRRGPPDPDQLNDAIRSFVADPYAWLRSSGDRLATVMIDDETAAVTLDGQPLLAPIGLTMKLVDGKWYVMLPTNVPGMGRILPSSDEGWEILGHAMQAMRHAIDDVAAETRSGQVRHLEDVARYAGEKAFLPVAFVMIAYGKAMEEEREARRAQQREAQQSPGGG